MSRWARIRALLIRWRRCNASLASSRICGAVTPSHRGPRLESSDSSGVLFLIFFRLDFTFVIRTGMIVLLSDWPDSGKGKK